MLIISFWKVINFSGASINFIAKKICVCAFNTFKFVLPLEGRSCSMDGIVIQSLIMTDAVAISIVICIIVVFAS